MLIQRLLHPKLIEAAQEFPVVALIGPRQSGKTTLAQTTFPQHRYVSLEDHDIRTTALLDPRRFLTDYPNEQGLILDEIQHAPHLLSYMQTIVDRDKKNGFFIVTGSQNFLVDQALTQTLAGRMAVLTLLPLALAELSNAQVVPERLEDAVYKGCYPKVYATHQSVERLYANYIRLYVERDVRSIAAVAELSTFQKFMRVCAARIGQLINISSLANDCGIPQSKAKAWLSALEASYLIFLLHPYYKNFGKRLIKSPKLYFVDTGLACSLLKIRSANDLVDHYLRGSLVESFLIADVLKQQHNLEQQPSIYFWRDETGHEIDCIIDETQGPIPVEIKAGKTVIPDFFKEFSYWQQLVPTPDHQRYVVYGGADNHARPQAQVLSWHAAGTLVNRLG